MTKSFIQDLVNDMTLEEKLAQLTQLGPHYWGLDDTVDLTGPFKELNIQPQVMENIGSVLNGIGARNVIDLPDPAFASQSSEDSSALHGGCHSWLQNNSSDPACDRL